MNLKKGVFLILMLMGMMNVLFALVVGTATGKMGLMLNLTLMGFLLFWGGFWLNKTFGE